MYFVKEGDTLTSISRFFGVDVDSIREVNRLASDGLDPGDRIRIPDKAIDSPHPAAGAARRPR